MTVLRCHVLVAKISNANNKHHHNDENSRNLIKTIIKKQAIDMEKKTFPNTSNVLNENSLSRMGSYSSKIIEKKERKQ